MRSIVVSPSAIRPAMTRQADARRSVAITLAPVSFGTPRTIAVLPSTSMSAPRRTSSCTCIIRFSKIVSVMTRRAVGARGERHHLRLHVGGKPGVRRGAELERRERSAPRTRIASPRTVIVGAGLAQLVEHRVERVGLRAGERRVAAGRRDRREERAGLDAVRHDRVRRAVQAVDTLDRRCGRFRRRRCAPPSRRGSARDRRLPARARRSRASSCRRRAWPPSSGSRCR